jgi:histone acetyltransferase (RNA polymerase elongator complex component)
MENKKMTQEAKHTPTWYRLKDKNGNWINHDAAKKIVNSHEALLAACKSALSTELGRLAEYDAHPENVPIEFFGGTVESQKAEYKKSHVDPLVQAIAQAEAK